MTESVEIGFLWTELKAKQFHAILPPSGWVHKSFKRGALKMREWKMRE